MAPTLAPLSLYLIIWHVQTHVCMPKYDVVCICICRFWSCKKKWGAHNSSPLYTVSFLNWEFLRGWFKYQKAAAPRYLLQSELEKVLLFTSVIIVTCLATCLCFPWFLERCPPHMLPSSNLWQCTRKHCGGNTIQVRHQCNITKKSRKS